ncbi:MAG: phosphatase PAP2 family protein [Ktedonobacterales bacterium]
MSLKRNQHDVGSPDDSPNDVGERVREAAGGVSEGVSEGVEQVVRRVARERTPRHRMLSRGRALLLIYALGVVALIALTLVVRASAVLSVDLPFTRELQENHNPLLAGFMFFISELGFPPYADAIFIIAVLLLVLFRLRLEALFLIFALVGDGIGALLKVIVARHRPTPNLVHVVQVLNSPSFPSGHTTHYTIFYGFLAFVLISSFKSSWLRNSLIVVCLALIALIGISRVYLGEHWLTDVLGGYLLGGLVLVLLVAAFLWAKARFNSETLRRLPHTEQPA